MTNETKLEPCPWCAAGETTIEENGRVWHGVEWGAPRSVSVIHHCPKVDGQPSRRVERIGRDRESAIAAWNRRAPLSCAPPASESQALTELRELRANAEVLASGFEVGGKRVTAAAIRNLFKLGEPLLATLPGSAPVADTEETTAAKCIGLCKDYALSVEDQNRDMRDAALILADLINILYGDGAEPPPSETMGGLERPAPPPARPFPTEEECRTAYHHAYNTEPSLNDISAGISAVRSLCLSALPAQTTSGTESDHLADASKMVPAAAPEPEIDPKTPKGNQ